MPNPDDLDLLRRYVAEFRRRAKALERHARSMAQQAGELERVLGDTIDAEPTGGTAHDQHDPTIDEFRLVDHAA